MSLASPLSLRVAAIERLSPSLARIVLEPAGDGLLPTAMPGAHLSLSLPGAERTFRNSYSITSSPDERSRYVLIVRRAALSRGGSHYVHDALQPGDVIASAAPNSQFTLRNTARKHLLIGGGIGVTPFLSFLPILRARGQRFEMHHFVKAGEVALFRRMLGADEDHRIQVHAARTGPTIEAILERQALGTHLYTCGPATLMDHVQHGAAALGWPTGRVHLESFGAAGGRPFRVRLGRSGGEVQVEEHETMLEALEQAGLAMPSLCRGGACGECVTVVIDGIPEHRDHFLSEAEKTGCTLVMPCVSRARTETLTLDI